MLNHALSDEWLLAYAAGALNEGQALVAACHVAFRPGLAEKVSDAEAVGGVLLHDMAGSDIEPAMLDAVLARLEGAPQLAARTQDRAPRRDIPAPLWTYLGGGLDLLKWRVLGPGLRHALLWQGGSGEKAWLLKGSGARVIPEHGHAGDEWTLVLKGAYEAQGERFTAGDLEMADEGVEHTPSLLPDEECICLAYTSSRIRPKSAVVRMMQPFIGL